ncbi:unnamed protein product [Cylicocyclus nassatus]|uniref:Uncharacterized protein n=1 Tax=Cylicocyclus nassatus TaxID=53992 RepID=A0AA36MDH3_CYLNA|nr:unnamed protein product [Cylicocyclus nassatus]
MTLWAVVLSHMSCALNPLIYAYGMPGFKKALREFFNISNTDQTNTGVFYSNYLRSSGVPKSQASLENRLKRYPTETLRKISAPTPNIKRSLHVRSERGTRRQTIDVTR